MGLGVKVLADQVQELAGRIALALGAPARGGAHLPGQAGHLPMVGPQLGSQDRRCPGGGQERQQGRFLGRVPGHQHRGHPVAGPGRLRPVLAVQGERQLGHPVHGGGVRGRGIGIWGRMGDGGLLVRG